MGIFRSAVRFRAALHPLPPNAYLPAEAAVPTEICCRRTAREDAVPAVLDANRRLADLPSVLPAGVLLVLPDLPEPSRVLPAVRLRAAVPAGIVLPEPDRRSVALGGVFRAAVRTRG